MAKVADIVNAMSVITGGRTVSSMEEVKRGDHPFVILKSSGIYGKEVLEIPGLIYGDPNKEVKKIAVCMTMTELVIELAGATGVDAVVAHHPIADAARVTHAAQDIYLALGRHKPGDTIKIKIFRDGATIEKIVTLQEGSRPGE